MSKTLSGLALCLLAMASPPPALAQESEASRAAVSRLLQQGGYEFKTVKPNVWTVPYTGRSLGRFDVIVTVKDEMALAFVILATRQNIRAEPEMQRTALNLNHRFYRARVGVDNDGDLFVRADFTAGVLNTAEFKRNLDGVATSADEAHAALKGWLSK